MLAQTDDIPIDVSVKDGCIVVMLSPTDQLSPDQARRLANDLVVAALEVEHQARAMAMGRGPRGAPRQLPLR